MKRESGGGQGVDGWQLKSTLKPNVIQRDWEVPPTLRALGRERANVGGLFPEPLEHASPQATRPNYQSRSHTTLDEHIHSEAQRHPAELGSPAYFARPDRGRANVGGLDQDEVPA